MKIFEIEGDAIIDAVMVEFRGDWTNLYYLSGGVIGVKSKIYNPIMNLYHLRATLDEALDNNDEVSDKVMAYIEKKLNKKQ